MNYEADIIDSVINGSMKDQKEKIVSFFLKQRLDHQSRDNYRESLEFGILFLGDILPRGVRFLALGSIHHARRMAKALSLKI